MARPVWTGHITFGLVNVPVVLYSAERRADLNLRLIDSRNDAKVRGAKGYVLLRDVLADSQRVGLATVVIRTRQYVAALRPYGDSMVLQLMRYEQELRDLKDFDMPESDFRKVKASKQERDMALQLIEGMTDKWDPERYHDEYHDAVMKLIKDKIASGDTDVGEPPEDETEEASATINFIDVLRRSVEKQGKPSSQKSTTRKRAAKAVRPARKKASSVRRTTSKTSKKRTRKKRAG